MGPDRAREGVMLALFRGIHMKDVANVSLLKKTNSILIAYEHIFESEIA